MQRCWRSTLQLFQRRSISGTVDNSTIYALSSAPGKAGVSVVRISGPAAFPAISALTQQRTLQPRHATLCKLTHPKDGELLDEALILTFPKPASFTGEDVAELHVHGSQAVIASVLDALGSIDRCQPAKAGDFTRRAFLHGKFDLTQVEGLADLIASETQEQRKQALRHYGGETRSLLQGWRQALLGTVAHVEAFIDFSEDENIEEDTFQGAVRKVEALRDTMAEHLSDNRGGERLRNGVRVVLTGNPNVGKSSLLNYLCNQDRAIVSAMAGTTRDVLTVDAELGGFPVVFVDTAGIRFGETVDVVEQEGVKRAVHEAQAADLRLCVQDASDPTSWCSPPTCRCRAANLPTHVVINKIDVATQSPAQLPSGLIQAVHPVSCSTGAGLPAMTAALATAVKHLCQTSTQHGPTLARHRHRQHLDASVQALQRALDSKDDCVVFAEELRYSLHQLGAITGHVSLEEILDVLFDDFCIGK